MTKPMRISSSFQYIDEDGTYFPHLYYEDIVKFSKIIEEISSYDVPEEWALALQRVMDWVIAESQATVFSVKMLATRKEDGTVAVQSLDTGMIGEGSNIMHALLSCVNEMAKTLNNLHNLDEEEQDTIGWAKYALWWEQNFPDRMEIDYEEE